jgi:predicted N-acyltransferase
MTSSPVKINVLDSIRQISAADWDACACPEVADGGRPIDPFTTHRFLLALEDSGSIGPRSGWQPHYMVAQLNGETIAAAPLFSKSHSQGEYIFDHNWAHAFEQAGGNYYPKLQIAVPFTPATGRRFLVRPGFKEIGQSALIQGAVQLATNNDLSSLHVTFCTNSEAKAGAQMGLLTRVTQQYHWYNKGYDNFDGFLSALSSRKRKMLRKERATAQHFGGEIHSLTGDELRPHHWDDFWTFYQDTGARKWGSPYLTRAFFDIAQETLRDDIVLVMATRDGQSVAGAMNMIGRDALFGRYWGCIEHHSCLHFELCYYQAMDWAIANGLARVEAGAQGDHKLARGYLPAQTHSLHWIADKGFENAVSQYLDAERSAIVEQIDVLTDYGPFRRPQVEEQQ